MQDKRDAGKNKGGQMQQALTKAIAGVDVAADTDVAVVVADASPESVDATDATDAAIAAAVAEQAALLAERQRFGYGEVECVASDSSVSEKYGRKSCAAIDVTIPIPHLGIKIRGAIYGNLLIKAEGTFVEFTGYIPPKSIAFVDADGKQRLLATMEHGAAAWIGYEKATAAAQNRLMGQTNKTGGLLERPRLVRQIVTKAVTA